jgi:hypothetical protein
MLLYKGSELSSIDFRCIAVENDKIKIVNDDVYLNENILNENINYDFSEITIEKNMVFLLGDNRYNKGGLF